MTRSKENTSNLTRTDYIRYLYNELQRYGKHKSPNAYQQIIRFIETPKGKFGFETFCQIPKKQLGIYGPEKPTCFYTKGFTL